MSVQEVMKIAISLGKIKLLLVFLSKTCLHGNTANHC